MSLKTILILCLSVFAMIAVIVFYFWWVGRELDRDEANDERLDSNIDENI